MNRNDDTDIKVIEQQINNMIEHERKHIQITQEFENILPPAYKELVLESALFLIVMEKISLTASRN